MTRTRHLRHGFTALELAVGFVISAVIASAAALAINGFLHRSDVVLADTTIDRVVTAQLSHAAGFGTYAYGPDGDDAALRSLLPEQLARDVTLTHGRSTGLDSASVAVSNEQSLVVAVMLPDGTCRWRTLPAISADAVSSATAVQDAAVLCEAAGLLPAGERPAWD